MFEIDHLAVACTDLEQAAATLEKTLGVTLSEGGQHPDFSTHNKLLRLGKGQYLEVISIDPAAPDPGRARWFDLDNFTGEPRLTNWIVRPADGAPMDVARAALPADLNAALGPTLALSRGDLRWRLTVPDDGRLPLGGMAPALIDWQVGDHPAERLPDAGCRLSALEVSHRSVEVLRLALGEIPKVKFSEGTPGLKAVIETPRGRIVL